MKARKLITILMASAMLVSSLAACQSGDTTSSEAAPPAAEASADDATPATDASAESPATDTATGESAHLVFWDMPWGPSEYAMAGQALAERFNSEHPDITVEYQSIPWDGWAQAFLTAVSSNSGPDVSTGAAFLQNRLALMGEVADVDSIIAEFEAEGKLDDFVPGTIDNFKQDGKQIAIPYNCDLRAMYYRTDLLEEAGIAVPTNWDEFYEAAKALTKDDVYGYVTAGTDASAQWNLMFWCMNNGAGYLDQDVNADMGNPGAVEALEYLQKMKQEELIPPGAAGYTGADASKLLYQGKAAMYVGAPALIGEMPADVIDKIDVMAPLTSPAGLSVNPGSTNGLILYADSQYQEAGKTFIKWWSDNGVTLWTDGMMGAFPARTSIMEDPFFQNDRMRKTFVDIIAPNTVQINYPVGSAKAEMDVFDGEYLYRDALQAAYTSDKSAQEILDDVNGRYQKAIDQMRASTN